jgi:hypothetical protein
MKTMMSDRPFFTIAEQENMRRVILSTLYMLLTLLSSTPVDSGRIVPSSLEHNPLALCEFVSCGESEEASSRCPLDSCDCESEECNALVSLVSAIPATPVNASYHRVDSALRSDVPHSIFHPPLFS